MGRGVSDFVGQRLEEARLARTLSQTSLAQLIGKSSTSVSAWESGRQAPDWESISKLSQVLAVRTGLFFNDLGGADRLYFYRSNASVTVTLQKKAHARLRWAEIIADELQEWIDFPDINFPKVESLPLGQIEDSFIEAAAAQARRHWSLGEGPIDSVVDILEAAGAIVVRDELGGVKMDGVSFWCEETCRPFILLAEDKASAVRSRFDAAHELAHLILHRAIQPGKLNKAEYAELERQAHLFASYFLLPTGLFLKELRRLDLDAFVSMKSRWKVSIAAIIMKARDLDVISDDYRQKLFIQMSGRGWRRQEPLDEIMQPERPSALSKAIRMVIEAGKYTRESFLDRIGLEADDVEFLSSLPGGYLKRDAAPVVKLRP